VAAHADQQSARGERKQSSCLPGRPGLRSPARQGQEDNKTLEPILVHVC
jgi:hypothetical protein